MAKSPRNKAKALQTELNTLRTLSDIGREITATLDLDKILLTIYKKVNKLMDAGIFGIGLYHADKKCIEYKLAIADHKRYRPYSREMKDKNQLPVWCIEHKKPVFINDVDKEYKKYIKKYTVFDAGKLEDGSREKVAHSLLYQPIIVGKKVVGIISVQSYRKNAYSLHHLDILQSIASYAGMAIENARHFHNIEEDIRDRTADLIAQRKEIEKSYKNTKLLSDIGKEISASLSVKEILDRTYQSVNKLMDAASFGIAIYDEAQNRLNFVCNIERGKPLPFHFVDVDKEKRPASWCFKNQKEVLINDLLTEYKKYDLSKPTTLAGEFTHSLIYFPLSTPHKKIGVITVQSFNRNAYTQYHLDILRNLAVYVVNALENARLYENMEEEVRMRTQEIIEQKEQTEKSYQNTKLLSDIGREITASLSVEEIIDKVYKSLNSLLDASVFAIGVYDEEKHSLCFPADIEKGKKLPVNYEELNDENRAAAWCFKNQAEMIVNDFAKDYGKYFPGKTRPPVPLAGEVPESVIYLPLSTATKQLGVLTVQSFRKNSYTEYHLHILRNLAIYVVIALENARLYENLKKRTQEITDQKEEIERSYQNTKLLSDIGREITACLSVEEIGAKVYKNINALMDASVFGIGLFNEKENRLDFPGVIEKGVKMPFGSNALNDSERPSVWCFHHQEKVVINDFKADYPKYFPGREDRLAPMSGQAAESLLYLPLSTSNKRLGVITVQSFKKSAYTEYHVNILRNLAIYVVIALENARLYGNMEAEVKQRTAEIEKQKDELARLSIVASETDNAVVITDAEGNIEWVNASYTRITGYTLEELRAQGGNIVEVSGNPNIWKTLEDCVKHHTSLVYDAVNTTKDGRELWLQTTLTPIVSEDGKIKHLVAIDSDITRLKLVETEIKKQNEIISEKNKHITDSINYAKRIQEAILPSGETIKSILPDSFVLFNPKDIVSGDFYWVTQKFGKIFFAVVDCTGHGVPGAFVSIIGHNGLYRAVNEFGLSRPSDILDKLNDLVEEMFRQNENRQISDGMDIALCAYDHRAGTLEFAGANNPIYIISDSAGHLPANARSVKLNGHTLVEVKGDKQPIGAFDKRKKFTNHVIPIKKNDCIYVFSDGYADQFGGSERKKFKYKKFKNLLLTMQDKAMVEQKKNLQSVMTSWMGDLEQVDDMCVIGVKV